MKIAGNSTKHRVVRRHADEIYHRGEKKIKVIGKYLLTGGSDPVIGTEVTHVMNGLASPVYTILNPWLYRVR